jgi:hypothetical protein
LLRTQQTIETYKEAAGQNLAIRMRNGQSGEKKAVIKACQSVMDSPERPVPRCELFLSLPIISLSFIELCPDYQPSTNYL